MAKVSISSHSEDRIDYVSGFNWDDTKFPRSRSLLDIATTIQERVKSIDVDIKTYIDKYAEANSQLNTLQKSKGTNFLNTDLSECIYGKAAKSDFVPEDSNYLLNMLVVVPARKAQDFMDQYDKEEEKHDT